MPSFSQSAFSKIFTLMQSGCAAAMDLATSAIAVGVTTFGGAATRSLVNCTPTARALPSETSAETSNNDTDSSVFACGLDLNR